LEEDHKDFDAFIRLFLTKYSRGGNGAVQAMLDESMKDKVRYFFRIVPRDTFMEMFRVEGVDPCRPFEEFGSYYGRIYRHLRALTTSQIDETLEKIYDIVHNHRVNTSAKMPSEMIILPKREAAEVGYRVIYDWIINKRLTSKKETVSETVIRLLEEKNG
jgi:hypothetical protein